jgi:LacI family transcriptional regulator
MSGLLSGDLFNAALILNTIAEDDQFLSRSQLPYPVVVVNRSIPGYLSIVEEALCARLGSSNAPV